MNTPTPTDPPKQGESHMGSLQDNTTPTVLGHEADNFNAGGTMGKGFNALAVYEMGERLTITRLTQLLNDKADIPDVIQVSQWQKDNILNKWDTFRGIRIKVLS